jgi:isoleucyl-tRNA synthetase
MKKHSVNQVPSMPDFSRMENELLEQWYQSGVVDRYLHRNNKSKKYFSFLDGPITANNPMGVHHGWGRTYKDLWQRFYNMKGYKQRFQNGFDSQGLWVEVEVEKELGFKSKKDIEKYGIAKFVDKCKERVAKYSKIQTQQSKRLGYFMDWDHSYFTMSDENNYMIWHFLKVCHKNGWLYKGKDVVPWCPRCETAISQHEMLTEDYKEVVHRSIYVKFKLKNRNNEYLLVWTTTPWTIPANTAVAVDGKIDYSLIETTDKQKYWIAKDRVNHIFGSKVKKVKQVKGKQLTGLEYESPFDHLPYSSQFTSQIKKRFHKIYNTDPLIMPISTQEGTGLVHTSTSTGQEDYKLGKKFNLPVVPTTDDQGYYLKGFGTLEGKNAKKNPELIINYLKKNGWLYKAEDYKHRYPACWRCKEELIWKVTDEWYIAMDKGKPTLRQRMKKVASKINWIPQFGLDRELDWLNNMNDWLISKKNRYWGLCLPIWECSSCGTFEVIGSKRELKEKSISGWKVFEGKSPHKPQIDSIILKCKKCGELSSRVEPVGNPWLDAGIVAYSTISEDNRDRPLYLKDRDSWQKWFPADFITESFPGQFKNWFYSLIAMSTVLEDKKPFKTVLGFGTLPFCCQQHAT